jgi:hypothetical protein
VWEEEEIEPQRHRDTEKTKAESQEENQAEKKASQARN